MLALVDLYPRIVLALKLVRMQLNYSWDAALANAG